MTILYLFFAGIFGGWLYRWRGGGWPIDHIPRLIKTAVCAIPYGLLIWFGTENIVATTISYWFSWFFLFQGHGSYQDAGRKDAETPNHKPQEYVGKYQEEDFVRILREIIPSGEIAGRRDLYEFVAMGFTGFLVTLIPGLMLATLSSTWLGILLILSGFTKGLAYGISCSFLQKNRTVWGEILTGSFMYSSLVAISYGV